MRDKKSKRKNERIESLLGKSMKIEGDVKFSGGLLVEGTVKGNIAAIGDGGSLTLAKSGSVTGDISAAIVAINGPVTGDIYASEHITLNESAVVNGIVYYDLLEISVGAAVNGNLVHKPTGKNRRGMAAPHTVSSSQGAQQGEAEDKK